MPNAIPTCHTAAIVRATAQSMHACMQNMHDRIKNSSSMVHFHLVLADVTAYLQNQNACTT